LRRPPSSSGRPLSVPPVSLPFPGSRSRVASLPARFSRPSFWSDLARDETRFRPCGGARCRDSRGVPASGVSGSQRGRCSRQATAARGSRQRPQGASESTPEFALAANEERSAAISARPEASLAVRTTRGSPADTAVGWGWAVAGTARNTAATGTTSPTSTPGSTCSTRG